MEMEPFQSSRVRPRAQLNKAKSSLNRLSVQVSWLCGRRYLSVDMGTKATTGIPRRRGKQQPWVPYFYKRGT